MAGRKTGKDVMDIAMSVAVVLGIGFAVLLFVILPNLLTTWIGRSMSNSFLINLLEGVIRIFNLYRIHLGYYTAG